MAAPAPAPAPAAVLPTQPSKLLSTALAAIDGYRTWTIDAILAPRAPHCTQQVLPQSLGRAPLSNDAYAAFFAALMPAFTDFRITVHEVFEDQAGAKVALHASSTARTPLGPYSNEYCLMFWMSEDHAKVVAIKEFVDSMVSVTYMTRLREYMAQQQQEESGET